jgi:hypothetical protein
MTLRVIIRDEAEEDLLEGALWYEGLEDGLGKDFVLEVRAAINRTSENPLLYPSLRSNPDVGTIRNFVCGSGWLCWFLCLS